MPMLLHAFFGFFCLRVNSFRIPTQRKFGTTNLYASFDGSSARTMFDKIWDDHMVENSDNNACLLYIDRHLVHEVTSPQAFEGLRVAGRTVRRPDCTLVTVDHNVPTSDRSGFVDVESS